MKAILVGPCLADFDPGYNLSICRILRARGFEVKLSTFFVPAPPGLVNRVRIDVGMALGYRKYYDCYIREYNEALRAMIRAERPDLILAIRGNAVLPETIEGVRGVVRVLWLHDRAGHSGVSARQLACYEHRFVFEGNDVPWLKQKFGLDAEFLPMGFDPEVYHPMPGIPRDIDLFFIGAYYAERRATLERLARDFRGRKLRFYGRNLRYREPDTWVKAAVLYPLKHPGMFVNRSLDADGINQMYARSKICLNMHHQQSELGCNPRVLEIMGSGAFQIVDAIPFVKENFGEYVETYGDYEELCATIERGLSDSGLRERLAAEGRRFALKGHTFASRIDLILERSGLAKRTTSEMASTS